MISQFGDFILELIGSYYKFQEDLSDEECHHEALNDWEKITSGSGYPFLFFKWFFSFKKTADHDHPLKRGGQSLFISFFENYYLTTTGLDLISSKIIKDKENIVHEICSYRNIEASDYEQITNTYNFEEMLSLLLNEQLHISSSLLKREVKNIFNYDVLDNSLQRVEWQLKGIKRTPVPKGTLDYNNILDKLYNNFKSKANSQIIGLLPRKSAKVPYTHSEKNEFILEQIFNNLHLKGKRFISKITKVEDFKLLLSESSSKKDYSRKIYFGADQGACIYSLNRIKEMLRLQFEIAKLCKNECLFLEKEDGEIIKLTKPHNLYASRHNFLKDKLAIKKIDHDINDIIGEVSKKFRS